MTTTDKKVTRVSVQAFASRVIGPKPRRIVVTLLPGDTVLLRLHGTQQREYIAIKDVFEVARSRRVFAQLSTARAAKRARR